MPPTPVRAHIPQTLDIVHQLPAQIVLQRHFRQRPRQAVDLLLAQGAHACRLVDVEARHQVRAGFGAEPVEGAQRFGDELVFGEGDAEDEDLRMSVEIVEGVWRGCREDYHFGGGEEGCVVVLCCLIIGIS